MKHIFAIVGLIIFYWLFNLVVAYDIASICLLCCILYWTIKRNNDKNKQS